MILMDSLPPSQEGNIKPKQFNLRALTVWAQNDYFHIEPSYRKSLIPTVLKINRFTTEISEIKSREFVTPTNISPYYFSFFLGIINLNGKRILFLTEEAELICTIGMRDIFKVTKPIFLFYNPKEKMELSEEQTKILINLVLIFEEGMYFSFAYNLTEPMKNVKMRDKSDTDSFFNWAHQFQIQLKKFDKMWSMPLIQGFVNKIEMYINAHKVKIILISRRSIIRGGPYQYTTGVDAQGYVANYVETEQILCLNDYLFSFVQIRGTVPVYWSQNFSYGISTGIKIEKSIEQNYSAFQSHMKRILDGHNNIDNILILNLLNATSYESKLIQNFEYLIKNDDNNPKIGYVHYDLHGKCENKNYTPFNKFILEKLRNFMEGCGFSALKMKQEGSNQRWELLYSQKGVIRVNCGTCIDRTNIAQSRLAAYQLLYILRHVDVKIQDFNEDLQFIDNNEPFAILYRNLWADNADSLSKQYIGTGSTESFAIRQGRLSYMTSIEHGITTITRTIRNLREQDQYKNSTVHFIINGSVPSEQQNNGPNNGWNNGWNNGSNKQLIL